MKMAIYRNDSEAPITVRIGETPGAPPNEWKCAPGKTVEGPANYRDAFHRAGLKFVEEIKSTEAPVPPEGVGILIEARKTVAIMQDKAEDAVRKLAVSEEDNKDLRARLAAAEKALAEARGPAKPDAKTK
jgi:hypothetical protein